MSWICPKCETENPERLKICEVCDTPREKSPVDKLKEELKKKYKDTAYRQFIYYHYNLLNAADQGDAISQYKVAEWFFGRKISSSTDSCDKIAFLWYKRSAQNGNVTSLYMLGLCYEEGRGTSIDKVEARKYYKKAADNGLGYALPKYLRLKYDVNNYDGVIKYKLSLLAAADMGDANSQFYLGEWFESHKRSKYNEILAKEWYNSAASRGHVAAMVKLGEYYEKLLAYQDAIRWYKKAADRGDKKACLKMAKSCLYGEMVYKDVEKAVQWFNMAGESISADDLCLIGSAYYFGDGVQKNYTMAVEYYRKSAKKGNAEAQYSLGVCYENGQGVSCDNEAALYWYKKASSQGHKKARECMTKINEDKKAKKRTNNTIGLLFSIIVAIISLVIFYFCRQDGFNEGMVYAGFILFFAICLFVSSINGLINA